MKGRATVAVFSLDCGQSAWTRGRAPVAVLLIGIMHGQGGREGTCSCVMIGYIVIIGMMYRRKGGYLQHIYKQHT